MQRDYLTRTSRFNARERPLCKKSTKPRVLILIVKKIKNKIKPPELSFSYLNYKSNYFFHESA